jgi:hypothetical protein
MAIAPTRDWTLMASHGVVLFFIAANPDATMREMADSLGITERRIARIVKDLADASMISIERTGRRNAYSVNQDARFRHPTLSHIPLGQFVQAINKGGAFNMRASDGRSRSFFLTAGLLASLELAAPIMNAHFVI